MNELSAALRALKPSVKNQGRIIVEYADGDYLLMLPSGKIEAHPTKDSAEAAAKRFFKKTLKSDIGVGRIEWRNLPS